MSISSIAAGAGVPCVDAGSPADPTRLSQRMRQILGAEGAEGAEGAQRARDEASGGVPDDEEQDALKRFIQGLFQDEFLRVMLFGDEEKLGPNAEAWD